MLDKNERGAAERRARRRARLPVALALVTIVVSSISAWALEQELLPFGMVGLAQDQTAVLSLVLVGTSDRPHAVCRVTASFVDASGQVLRDQAGKAVQETFVLKNHVAVQLTLRSEDILANGELRKPVRAVVGEAPNTCSDCRRLVGTMETFLSNGLTQGLSMLQVGPRDPPPPDPCG